MAFLLRGYRPVVIALLGVVLIAIIVNTKKPCRATFEQVRIGMTLEEVERTVGGPPGDYRTDEWCITEHGTLWSYHTHWTTNECELSILFYERRVYDFAIVNCQKIHGDSWLRRLANSLGF
jgi:hypothetical protein